MAFRDRVRIDDCRRSTDMFIFKNDTKAIFEDDDETEDSSLDEQIAQRREVKRFLREGSQEEQDGRRVFKAALPIRAGSGKAVGWQVERTLSASV